VSVRVRIKIPPKEKDIDGVPLDNFQPGTVRDVSASLATWLVAQGYAEPEMRRSDTDDLDFSARVKPARATADDRRPRRRSTDR
jgi:hypothetical protein